MTKVMLPSWEHCAQKVKDREASALEAFIYHNEPMDAADFRNDLLAVLKECSAVEPSGLQCPYSTDPTRGPR